MNFIKLLPILFLGLPGSGNCRALEQQLLPSIPGYVPVYIQTGNVPPDVEALYQARKVVEEDQATSASENTEVYAENSAINEKPKGEAQEKNEELEPKQPVEEQTKDEEQENKKNPPPKSPDEQNKPEDEKNSEVQKSEENMPSVQETSGKMMRKMDDVIRLMANIKEIPQYEVKESQVE